jgi:hypothetical protein
MVQVLAPPLPPELTVEFSLTDRKLIVDCFVLHIHHKPQLSKASFLDNDLVGHTLYAIFLPASLLSCLEADLFCRPLLAGSDRVCACFCSWTMMGALGSKHKDRWLEVLDHVHCTVDSPQIEETFQRIVACAHLCADVLDKITILKGAIL